MIENAVILGIIVFALVWVIRRFAWDVNGLKAMWLTMGVSLAIALADWALAAGWQQIELCQLGGFISDPGGFIGCLIQMIRTVVEAAGVIFVSAEVIYKVLRLKIASELV